MMKTDKPNPKPNPNPNPKKLIFLLKREEK